MDISKISSVGSPKSKMIYHENTEALHIGTLDKHCYFIPFSKDKTRLKAGKTQPDLSF